jgi:hypothetical protein
LNHIEHREIHIEFYVCPAIVAYVPMWFRIGLHTSEKMDDARHIYEALGINIYKEIDPIYGMRYFLYKLGIT